VGRVKTPWSIYIKMNAREVSFDQVMDVFGFRVVVPTVPECYHALGAVHSLYKPLDARFRDFIAIPKANGYQSLHTVLFGPYGSPIEVQIRTEEMDLVAERGMAAHWVYKHGGDPRPTARRAAPTPGSNLLESSSVRRLVAGIPRERQGRPVPGRGLPVHAQGRHPGPAAQRHRARFRLCGAHRRRQPRGGRARGQEAGAAAQQAGQRPDRGNHHRQASAAPNPQWLEFVVSKARTAIRQQLKHLSTRMRCELGHRMLDRALEALDSSLDRVPAKTLEQYLAENRLRRLEDLLAEVALGNRMPQQVAQALTQAQGGSVSNKPGPMSEKILISGAERGVLSFANCCHPIPGDEIMGFLSSGKGVVVHRLECPNVAEYRKSPERCVPIAWDRSVQGDYRAALRVEVENKPGVLAQVAAAIAEAESNIDNVEYRERDLRLSVMDFNIEVKHRKHLADVIRRVRRLGVVNGVQRL
jgi:guanosine-3',5'-bis(diphosphate) 3'-pyrophosphohydrolase